MFRGDEGLFDEAFMYGCPKFITAALPAYDNPSAAGPQEVRERGRAGKCCLFHSTSSFRIGVVQARQLAVCMHEMQRSKVAALPVVHMCGRLMSRDPQLLCK
jgi:hypothetical protein